MMKKLYFFSFLFLNLILIFSFRTISAQENATPIKECKVSLKEEVKYKLISIGRTVGEPYITGLRIVVKDKYFNKDDMVQLTKIIKARYCNEEIISVVMFDDAKVAKQARAVIDQLAGNRKVPEIRGFYSMDRKTEKEIISFSTKRGNPADEISIQLQNNSLL